MPSDDPRTNGNPGTSGQSWVNSTIPFKVGEGTSGPMVPLLAQSVGSSLSQVGLMEAIFSLSAMVGSFIWGRASDGLQRRRAFILIGFAGTAIALVMMGLSTSFTEIMAFRALHGFLIAAYVAVAGALLIERSSRERLGRDMGYMNMVGGYAFIGGMLLGAVVVVLLGIRDLFFIAAFLTATSLGASVLLIREPKAIMKRVEIHENLADVPVPALNVIVQRRLVHLGALIHRPKLTPIRKQVLLYLLALFGVMVGGVATFALFPLLLWTSFGASPVVIFLVLLGGSFLSALFYMPIGRLADRLGFKRMLTMGLGLRSLVFVLLAISLLLFQSLLFVGFINLLAGVTWAFIMTTGPTALFRTFDIQRRGEMMGYYNMFLGLGSAAGAAAGGFIAHFFGFVTLLTFSALMTAVSTLVIGRLQFR